jgi:hypothetical protein
MIRGGGIWKNTKTKKKDNNVGVMEETPSLPGRSNACSLTLTVTLITLIRLCRPMSPTSTIRVFECIGPKSTKGYSSLTDGHSITLRARRNPQRRARSLSSTTLLHRTLDFSILIIDTHSSLQNTAFLDWTARYIGGMTVGGLKTQARVAVGVGRGLGRW